MEYTQLVLAVMAAASMAVADPDPGFIKKVYHIRPEPIHHVVHSKHVHVEPYYHHHHHLEDLHHHHHHHHDLHHHDLHHHDLHHHDLHHHDLHHHDIHHQDIHSDHLRIIPDHHPWSR